MNGKDGKPIVALPEIDFFVVSTDMDPQDRQIYDAVRFSLASLPDVADVTSRLLKTASAVFRSTSGGTLATMTRQPTPTSCRCSRGCANSLSTPAASLPTTSNPFARDPRRRVSRCRTFPARTWLGFRRC